MMAEDRVMLAFVSWVCVIGASALLAYGHVLLCVGMAALGAFAWHVAIREVQT